MPLYGLLIVALGVGANPAAPNLHLEGVVENGTLGGARVEGAEVILRAGQDGAFVAVAKTVTDQDGRFHFYNLRAEPGMVYLPGANRHGVHYPGPRLHLDTGAPPPPVRLTVFDAVTEPSPLVAERHAIDVRLHAGVLEVTETLHVSNPTMKTYVGQADKKLLTTLSLTIPPGFERVTFSTEFFGRRFSVLDNRLVTDLPWLPGRYELKFTYHLPAAGNPLILERALDIPTSAVLVRADAGEIGQVTCNLPRATATREWPLAFESSGATLVAGHQIKLVFGDLPATWTMHGRWIAIAILFGLIIATVASSRLRIARQARPLARLATRHGRSSVKRAAGGRRRTSRAASD
jgi:hypothetical protein